MWHVPFVDYDFCDFVTFTPRAWHLPSVFTPQCRTLTEG